MRLSKLSFILFLFIPTLCFAAFPTTGILDNFNRANEGPPPSASWTDVVTGLKVVSNQCVGNNTLGYNVANWNTTVGPDYEIYATVANIGVLTDKLYLQFEDSSLNGYGILWQNLATPTLNIVREDADSDTNVGSTYNLTLSAGDAIGFSKVGSTLTAYYKASGGSWTQVIQTTDATYNTTGKLQIAVKFADIILDNFGGGTYKKGGNEEK